MSRFRRRTLKTRRLTGRLIESFFTEVQDAGILEYGIAETIFRGGNVGSDRNGKSSRRDGTQVASPCKAAFQSAGASQEGSLGWWAGDEREVSSDTSF